MNQDRRKFSVCIPAYNRARYLAPLLDSIFDQDYKDFDVVICEDNSRERQDIAAVVRRYQERYPGAICYDENERNLGYDGNIRNLIEKATGEYCFFMGNDDLMCPGALSQVADILSRNDNVGLVLKSYAWFEKKPENIKQEVRYFSKERAFAAGPEAIRVCFRRSGVISGYIVHRDAAQAAATTQFDGSLYYQMHVTTSVLCGKCAVFTPQVLVLCRGLIPPEFGNSDSEKGKYVPGWFTPQARLNMIGGALSILKNLKETRGVDVVEEVTRDYANYFYPYIRDQLTLPFGQFMKLYRSFGRMGFKKYPMFHLYFAAAYLLGEQKFDAITNVIRGHLGRSPQFGSLR